MALSAKVQQDGIDRIKKDATEKVKKDGVEQVKKDDIERVKKDGTLSNSCLCFVCVRVCVCVCLCVKAIVDVNEEGSEAAAATAVVMMKRSIPIVHPFIVDHPFLFFIIDKRAEVIMFSGHVTNPPTTAEAQSKDEL